VVVFSNRLAPLPKTDWSRGLAHWPGASSLDALMHGKPLTASRPRHFFRDDGPLPVGKRWVGRTP